MNQGVKLTAAQAFEHSALIEQCVQSPILRRVNIEGANADTLRDLINMNNSLNLRKMPITFSKMVIKLGLGFLCKHSPSIGAYINPNLIRVQVEPDELEYLETTRSNFKPNIVFIVAKNIVFSVFGSTIDAYNDNMLEHANRELDRINNSNATTDYKPVSPPKFPTPPKVSVANIVTEPVVITPPASYTNVFSNIKGGIKQNNNKSEHSIAGSGGSSNKSTSMNIKPLKRLNSRTPSPKITKFDDECTDTLSCRSYQSRKSKSSHTIHKPPSPPQSHRSGSSSGSKNKAIKSYMNEEVSGLIQKLLESTPEHTNEIYNGEDDIDDVGAAANQRLVISCETLVLPRSSPLNVLTPPQTTSSSSSAMVMMDQDQEVQSSAVYEAAKPVEPFQQQTTTTTAPTEAAAAAALKPQSDVVDISDDEDRDLYFEDDDDCEMTEEYDDRNLVDEEPNSPPVVTADKLGTSKLKESAADFLDLITAQSPRFKQEQHIKQQQNEAKRREQQTAMLENNRFVPIVSPLSSVSSHKSGIIEPVAVKAKAVKAKYNGKVSPCLSQRTQKSQYLDRYDLSSDDDEDGKARNQDDDDDDDDY